MSYIVEVSDLWWRYSPETEWVLRGVNLRIREGESVALLGPTGAGKTTLLLMLQAILPHAFPNGMMMGEVIVDGFSVRTTSSSKLAGRVGLVFEDAESQFIFPTVDDDLRFTLQNLGISPEETEKRLARILREFGLEKLTGRTASELSGGQKQRVAIAGLLAAQPKILLLDEPTAELDPVGKRDVMTFVRKMKDETGTTLLIVEQDIEDITTLVDRMLLMVDGRIVMEGTPREFLMHGEELHSLGVCVPELALVFKPLVEQGVVERMPLTVDEGIELLKRRS
ncbi:MAG: ABC transporter ATP-binding protein [Nitrososphaerota archaeon]